MTRTLAREGLWWLLCRAGGVVPLAVAELVFSDLAGYG
jgi:hypothetical protein